MPSHLTSVKLPKKGSHNSHDEVAVDSPKFPFGLQISLNDDTLKALKIKELPTVGTQMIVLGVGTVTSISQRSRENSTDRDVSIQLEEIEVGALDEKAAVSAIEKAIKEV